MTGYTVFKRQNPKKILETEAIFPNVRAAHRRKDRSRFPMSPRKISIFGFSISGVSGLLLLYKIEKASNAYKIRMKCMLQLHSARFQLF